MTDEDRQDNGASRPAQIPLLEDVIDPEALQQKAPRRKSRVNYSLDLDPDPPKTRDLFDTIEPPLLQETAAPDPSPGETQPVGNEVRPAPDEIRDDEMHKDEMRDVEPSDDESRDVETQEGPQLTGNELDVPAVTDDADAPDEAIEIDPLDEIEFAGIAEGEVEFEYPDFSDIAESIGGDLADDHVESAPPDAGEALDSEARLRAGANRVVDDLVREYSHEIIRRLRQELSTLLDELQEDQPPDKS